jgi:rhodanese-related sulfurtransferase
MVWIFGHTRDRAPVPAISVRDVKRRLDRGGDVVVVDVRQPTGYDAYPGTIPGSIRIPPTQLPERYQELPHDRPLVLVCT